MNTTDNLWLYRQQLVARRIECHLKGFKFMEEAVQTVIDVVDTWIRDTQIGDVHKVDSHMGINLKTDNESAKHKAICDRYKDGFLAAFKG